MKKTELPKIPLLKDGTVDHSYAPDIDPKASSDPGVQTHKNESAEKPVLLMTNGSVETYPSSKSSKPVVLLGHCGL